VIFAGKAPWEVSVLVWPGILTSLALLLFHLSLAIDQATYEPFGEYLDKADEKEQINRSDHDERPTGKRQAHHGTGQGAGRPRRSTRQ
jgi:hypothetical protein